GSCAARPVAARAGSSASPQSPRDRAGLTSEVMAGRRGRPYRLGAAMRDLIVTTTAALLVAACSPPPPARPVAAIEPPAPEAPVEAPPDILVTGRGPVMERVDGGGEQPAFYADRTPASNLAKARWITHRDGDARAL